MRDKKAFLVIYIPNKAWNLPQAYVDALEAHKQLETPGYRIPWPTDMVPEKGETVQFVGLGGPVDFVAQEKEYTYSAESGYESRTTLCLAEGDWREGSLDLFTLRTYAEEGFYLETEVSIKRIIRDAGLVFPDESYPSIRVR